MQNEDVRDDAFTNLIEIIVTRKSLILLGFLSVFLITLILTSLMPPVYEAASKILITKPLTPQINIPSVTGITNTSFVNNQKEIIKSRFIYEKVVWRLNLHQKTKPPSFLSNIKSSIKNKLFAKFYQAKPNPIEEAINSLREATEVTSKRGLNIVEITAQSESPKLAATIANTLAQTYIEYANDFLFVTSQKAHDFIVSQVEAARLKLDQSQKALEEFQNRERPISPQDEIKKVLRDMNLYNAQLRQINIVINEKENRGYRGATKGPRAPLEEIKTRLENLRAELDVALTSYMEDHPSIIKLRKRIAKLEKNLHRGVSLNTYNTSKSKSKTKVGDSQLTDLKNKRIYLLKQIQGLTSKLNKLSKKKPEPSREEFELLRLTGDFENNIKIYANILERLQNVQILKTNEMKENGTIKILDLAFPPSNTLKKKKVIFLALGGIMGIIFGLAMAFIAEYADDSLKTIEETEKYLNLPVLSAISPFTKKMRKTSS